MYVAGFIWSFLGKFSPTKILQMICCQNKTSFSWSYRDLSKRSLKNNVISRRGKRKIHTLRWVDMFKWQRMIPRHKGSPRYRIAHGWKIEYGSFNLEALKFLMHFRKPGSSLYFYFYTYFFSFSHISLPFFLSHFFLSFFLIKILFAPLLTLKLHRTYLLPHA
jgi:hypothetical protein